eukprot:613680-Rhodomonas_salina.1
MAENGLADALRNEAPSWHPHLARQLSQASTHCIRLVRVLEPRQLSAARLQGHRAASAAAHGEDDEDEDDGDDEDEDEDEDDEDDEDEDDE